MNVRPEERVRWTDPNGLRAQAARQAEIAARRPAARSGFGAPTSPVAPTDPERLEEILGRLRDAPSDADETLVHLAWEYFAAGFVARSQGATNGVIGAPGPGDAGPIFSPAARAPASGHSLADLVSTLTPRRLEVLRLVAKGLTNREIGDVLGISAYTVKAHVAGVLEALDLTNRTEAAVALREYEAEQAAI